MKKIKFNENGLVPAIVQDVKTKDVLMLGYMNQAAYQQTIDTKKVTFFSRSKNRLWMKGEESGNVLELVSLKNDCDQDTLLIQANPKGPTCHAGTTTCWGESENLWRNITDLEDTIADRIGNYQPQSYISTLVEKGLNKVAQKVGEEAVEMVIEAKDDNPDLFLNESADLFFHYLILLHAKDFALKDVLEILEARKK